MKKGPRIAMALVLIAALLSLTDAYLDYRRTGSIAYRKIALAIGVPALFYAILRSPPRAQ